MTFAPCLFTAFNNADADFHNAIKAAFPSERAGDVRYTAKAKGDEGTPLRAAHDAFETARVAWVAERESELTTL